MSEARLRRQRPETPKTQDTTGTKKAEPGVRLVDLATILARDYLEVERGPDGPGQELLAMYITTLAKKLGIAKFTHAVVRRERELMRDQNDGDKEGTA